MVKMVVSDLDGTLLNSNSEIPNRNKLAIKKLNELEIPFILASGRSDELMKAPVYELGIDHDVIMCNGGMIGNPINGNVSHNILLHEEEVKIIVNLCEENSIKYLLFNKSKISTQENYRVEYFRKQNSKYSKDQKINFTLIDDIEMFDQYDDVNKILILDEKNNFISLFNDLKLPRELSVVVSQRGFVDINPPNVSKGAALKLISESYDIPLKNIAVFGDQDNDETMLEIAGYGVAMANASPKAKAAANYRTKSNVDDGFAYWLEENVF